MPVKNRNRPTKKSRKNRKVKAVKGLSELQRLRQENARLRSEIYEHQSFCDRLKQDRSTQGELASAFDRANKLVAELTKENEKIALALRPLADVVLWNDVRLDEDYSDIDHAAKYKPVSVAVRICDVLTAREVLKWSRHG